METIRKLFAASETESCRFPAGLRSIYGGDLCFPRPPKGRPYLITNFVTSLDGVVSFNIRGKSAGDKISGSNTADQFTMGLLRAAADAVVVGSTTFEVAGHDTLWFPESTYRAAKKLYESYRKRTLKKTEMPVLAIVTGSGDIDFSFSVFHEPGQRVVILTTERGRKNLAKKMPRNLSSVEVAALSKGRAISPIAIVSLLKKEYKAEFLLNEGGPTLFGQFLGAGLVDELFLTVSPQIVGRGKRPRIALVEGTEFLPGHSPWGKLESARQGGSHLFLRYRFERK